MLELLIVMAVMAILVSALVIAGTALIDNAKTSKTAFTIGVIRDAVEQLAEEQRTKPTLARQAAFQKRYDFYPPDELEMFTDNGIPYGPARSFVPGSGTVHPKAKPPYTKFTFQLDGLTDPERALEHRDTAAMWLAIKLFSESASVIIDGLPEQNRMIEVDAMNRPLRYLDRDGNGMFDAGEDMEIPTLVDEWRVPLTYFSQRDFDSAAPTATESTNDKDRWNATSTYLVRLNGNKPVILSYGPDGSDQLKKEMIDAAQPPATILEDFEGDGLINSSLNADNIYSDPGLTERFKTGSR